MDIIEYNGKYYSIDDTTKSGQVLRWTVCDANGGSLFFINESRLPEGTEIISSDNITELLKLDIFKSAWEGPNFKDIPDIIPQDEPVVVVGDQEMDPEVGQTILNNPTEAVNIFNKIHSKIDSLKDQLDNIEIPEISPFKEIEIISEGNSININSKKLIIEDINTTLNIKKSFINKIKNGDEIVIIYRGKNNNYLTIDSEISMYFGNSQMTSNFSKKGSFSLSFIYNEGILHCYNLNNIAY